MPAVETRTSAAPRVLAYERTDPRDHSLDWLRAQGVEVVLGRAATEPGFRRYSDTAIVEDARGVDAVIGSSTANFPRHVIAALPTLRAISKYGIGVDSIDLAAATEHGVQVANTIDGTSVHAVAEHAIAMMLALRKRLCAWTPEYLQAGGWRGGQHATMMLGSTVGIVGFGRIGRAVAQRLSGWGVKLLAYDPYAVDTGSADVDFVDLPDLLGRSDVVTLHCGATDDNRHLIDAQALDRMKPEAILVNTGRGTLVDTEALTVRLRDGRLAGAALDVFEQEPPDPTLELLRLPNLVATPHVASWTFEIFLERRMQGARNLLAMLNGQECPAVVNPQARAVRPQGASL